MIKEVAKNIVSDRPLVSFIIPAYNLEKYISRAISSVFEQKGDWIELKELEIVVVNDGSKDGTKEKISDILNSEKGKQVNWILVDQTNSGVSAARNVGLDNARGEYIRFLDGDDTVPSGSTQKLLETSQKFESDFVFGKFVMETMRGKIIMTSDELFKSNFGEIKTKKVDKKRLIADFLCFSPFIHLGNILLKSSVIEREKVRFTPGTKIAEDFEFIAKAIYNSSNVAFLNENVYFWLYRKSSVTKTNNLSMFHYVGVMKRLEKYFKSKSEFDIATHIEKQAIPIAYGQVLGILAYNRLDYKLWRELVKNNEIMKHVTNIRLDEKKRGFHSKMVLANKVFRLSPTILYVIMRMARKYHDFWTE